MESIFIPGPTSVVHPGDLVDGRYRIVSLIAHGGMGSVFLAEHAMIKRRVALKVLHPELASDRAMVQRFLNEASAAGTLGHPHIVESTDMGFTPEGVPFIVFELLHGTMLSEEVYRTRGMPPQRALRIASQIASALEAAHAAGIVHLDLKSDNVMLVDRDGSADHVKVLDFGIARFMESETDPAQRDVTAGTPEFMAPEQLTAPDQVDGRTDVWALGVVLYEMLAARRPFSLAGGARLLFHRILHEVPPALNRRGAPAALEHAIIERMLAKDPAERYGSMRECRDALDAMLRDTEPPTERAVVDEQVHRPAGGYRRPVAPAKRWPTGVLALALVAAAGGGGLLYAEQRMIASIDDAAVHELESNAAQLSAVIATSAPGDELDARLEPLRRRLSGEVLGATVTGLGAPIVLVPRTDATLDAVELAVPVTLPPGIATGTVSLRAEYRPTVRGETLRTARYGAWTASGVLLFGFFAIGAAGGRRTRRSAALVPARATPR